jgi:hypothetical protein
LTGDSNGSAPGGTSLFNLTTLKELMRLGEASIDIIANTSSKDLNLTVFEDIT